MLVNIAAMHTDVEPKKYCNMGYKIYVSVHLEMGNQKMSFENKKDCEISLT